MTSTDKVSLAFQMVTFSHCLTLYIYNVTFIYQTSLLVIYKHLI